MARARNIKPGFFKNEDLAECSIWARFIFPGLWMMADREGRLEDRPKRVKGELLPYDEEPVEPLLDELAKHGFLVRYEVDGSHYIQIVNFNKHQNPHRREQASEIPPPTAGLGHVADAKEEAEARPRPDPETDASTQKHDLGTSKDAPENRKADLARGVSPADPPISDSPFSDSPFPHPLARAREGGPATKGSDVTRALKAAGIGAANPSHPMLLMLLEAGATADEFVQAADKARDKSKPFEYLLGVVKGERERAVKASNGVHKGSMPSPPKSYRERDADAKAAQAKRWTTKPKPAVDTIEMEAPDDRKAVG